MGCCCGNKPIVIKEDTPEPIIIPIREPSEPSEPIEEIVIKSPEIPSAQTEDSVKLIKSINFSLLPSKPAVIIKKASEPKYSKIKIKCDTYETMFYIWVHKDESLKFRVEGKWIPDPSCPECDSKGFPTYTMEDFNYGALVGRILGDKYFNIANFSVYTSPVEGPLLMKMFSPRFHLKSSGELTVYIYGGKKISKEEMNKRIGWNTTLINGNFAKFTMSTIEEELLVDINKMRSNAKLYCKLYVGADRVLTAGFLNKQENELKCFNLSWKLMSLLKEYWDIFYNQRKGGKLTHEEQISLFLREREVSNCQIIAQQYDEINPHKICIKMIQNAVTKEILFQKEFKEVGIRTIMAGNNKVITSLVFGDMKDYVYRGGAY